MPKEGSELDTKKVMAEKFYTVPARESERKFYDDARGVIVPAKDKEDAWRKAQKYHDGCVPGAYGTRKVGLAKSKIHQSTAKEIISSPIFNKYHRKFRANIDAWSSSL